MNAKLLLPVVGIAVFWVDIILWMDAHISHVHAISNFRVEMCLFKKSWLHMEIKRVIMRLKEELKKEASPSQCEENDQN
jgi:hypothetical protein